MMRIGSGENEASFAYPWLIPNSRYEAISKDDSDAIQKTRLVTF
jgi:hypothetical protein